VKMLVTGIHQRTAPLEVRECLAFTPAALIGALGALHQVVPEGFIVSTCNRIELYGIVPDGVLDAADLQAFLLRWHGLDAMDLSPYFYTYEGNAAVHHLFRLAAGLDSTVLGDDQIMGQLKDAYAAARSAGTSGKLLHRLVTRALTTGKRVRSQTGIASHPVSVVSVALDLARQTIGSLQQQRVLVIGAGHMGELVLKHLHGGEVTNLRIANHHDDHARAVAQRYGVQAVPYAQLSNAIIDSDIIISCTAAAEYVVKPDHFAMAPQEQSFLLLDLAMPRDIDPAVAERSQIQIHDIDAIQGISAENRAARTAEIAQAESLVQEEVVSFDQWLATQQTVPTITALREHAETIRQAELQRMLARHPDLSDQAQEAIQAFSTALINKLLHDPIISLKDPSAAPTLVPAVRRLFQLPELERESHVLEH